MPDKLNESALNEATLPIQVFGMELVSCVMCNLWYNILLLASTSC